MEYQNFDLRISLVCDRKWKRNRKIDQSLFFTCHRLNKKTKRTTKLISPFHPHYCIVILLSLNFVKNEEERMNNFYWRKFSDSTANKTSFLFDPPDFPRDFLYFLFYILPDGVCDQFAFQKIKRTLFSSQLKWHSEIGPQLILPKLLLFLHKMTRFLFLIQWIKPLYKKSNLISTHSLDLLAIQHDHLTKKSSTF